MCAQIHIIFLARHKQGSKNEWRQTYQQTFGQTRGPWQPIQPQPYNSIMLTRRNEMGWDGWGSGFFIFLKKHHLASVLYAGMICLVIAFYFAYMHANSPGEEHLKKKNYTAKFCLQTFGGSKLGSIKLEAGAETLRECKFLKMNPSHSWKKNPETWKTAKNQRNLEN